MGSTDLFLCPQLHAVIEHPNQCRGHPLPLLMSLHSCEPDMLLLHRYLMGRGLGFKENCFVGEEAMKKLPWRAMAVSHIQCGPGPGDLHPPLSQSSQLRAGLTSSLVLECDGGKVTQE